jgi:hypothetical protein
LRFWLNGGMTELMAAGLFSANVKHGKISGDD